jgi:hypothetical protein
MYYIYAIDADPDPDLDCCSGSILSRQTEIDSGKVIVICTSHAARILSGLEENDLKTMKLTKPEWVADKISAEELKHKLLVHKAEAADLII